MNLDQTLKLMYGKCSVKAEKKAKDSSASDATDASASDISAENPSTFYGPNTDMGPAVALDPE